MNYANLLDGTSALIVVGGTLLATLLRCGLHDCAISLQGLSNAMRPRFNAEKARSELALQIQDIRNDGLVRAEAHHFGDSEFDDMTNTLLEQRSLSALVSKHNAHKARRTKASEITIATLNQAAEMGPVFGLIGTLIALSQIQTDAGGKVMVSASIPSAIITTFYGLIIANMVFGPLARFVRRRTDAEEEQREGLTNWLTDQLARSGVRASHRREEQVAA